MGNRVFNKLVTFGALEGPQKHTSEVGSVQLSFELISVGDGKIYFNSKPAGKFYDLQIDCSADAQNHPLEMAMMRSTPV